MAGIDFMLSGRDLLPAIQRTLVGLALPNLTGCTVQFILRRAYSRTVVINAPATIVDPIALVVAYAWQAADLPFLLPGWYYGEFLVTAPDGRQERFPRLDVIRVLVDRDLQDP